MTMVVIVIIVTVAMMFMVMAVFAEGHLKAVSVVAVASGQQTTQGRRSGSSCNHAEHNPTLQLRASSTPVEIP
ncbi:hypothetical protein OL229_13905 [Neisseriaceae bacterium JH1-16]|nr:hypothetical protein [Neisseriaceae bacterium JH1-16]